MLKCTTVLSPESEIDVVWDVAHVADSVFEAVRGGTKELDPRQRSVLSIVLAGFAAGGAQGGEQGLLAQGSVERATGPNLVSRADLAEFAQMRGSRVDPNRAWRVLCGYNSPHFLEGDTGASVMVDGVLRSAIGVYDEDGAIVPDDQRLSSGKYMDVRHVYHALSADCNYPPSPLENPTGAGRFPAPNSPMYNFLTGFVKARTDLDVRLRLPGDPGMPTYDRKSRFLLPVKQVERGPTRVVTPDLLAAFAKQYGGVDQLRYWRTLFAQIAKYRKDDMYIVRDSRQGAASYALSPESFTDIIHGLEEMGGGKYDTTYSRKARDTAVRYIRAISSQHDYLLRQ